MRLAPLLAIVGLAASAFLPAAGASAEPLWVTVPLAPFRVLAQGRFDAAVPPALPEGEATADAASGDPEAPPGAILSEPAGTGATDESPDPLADGAAGSAEAEPAREPLWRTVALAPARVLAHGRFAAAAPTYHAGR